MADGLDVFRYIGYLRQRWMLVASTCVIAVALAAGVSLLLPRQYTATARIVIEPPVGTDPRAVLSISAIYLESLKTYEDFATSDSLFQKAVDRFQLRGSAHGVPIESLKQRVLKAAVPRNTRILEISATLPDAQKAHALAQFVAEQTVETNHALIAQNEREEEKVQQKSQAEERTTDQGELGVIETLLRAGRNPVGRHDERLTILDPGVVPERPSAPNVALNLMAALVLGLVLPLLYLAVALAFQQHRAESRRGAMQSVGQSAR
jgi:tyrosine-protein kinase